MASTLIGALAGFALLAASTLLLGNALLRIPIQDLRVAVGSLLLILGLQWLKKALLRLARPRARKNAAAEVQNTGEIHGIDWYAFVVAFKAIMLEGLEIVFIVVTFGAEANHIGIAAGSAVAALVAVGGIALLTRRWLSRIPREWLRFGVGVILAVFGMFWTAEGAGVRWPGGDWSLVWLLGVMALTAFGYRALLRCREPARVERS
jgi:uncharacterized membrane protein